MFVKVMSSLISGVVGYFRCFNFLCEFYFLYCDDVPLGAVYEFFSASILFLMPFTLIWSMTMIVIWLIVVCEWVGGDLLVMGCCVVCAWCCCYDL